MDPQSLPLGRVEELLNQALKAPALEFDEETGAVRPPAGTDVVLVAGSLRDRQVVLSSLAQPVSEAMKALAEGTHSEWKRARNLQILTDSPEVAEVVLLSTEEANLLKARALQPLMQLSSSQQDKAVRSGWLSVADLTPAQRDGLGKVVRITRARGGSNIAMEALDLVGVGLRLHTTPTAGGPPTTELSVIVSGRDGQPFPILHIPAANIAVHSTPSARSWMRPSIPWGHYVRTTRIRRNKEADLGADARLEQRVKSSGGSVSSALIQAASECRIPLVAATELHARRLTSNPRVGGGGSGREILESVETATAGQWIRSGEFYVLAPHPLVERAAALQDQVRTSLVIPETAAGIGSSLSRAQRSRMRSSLPATELRDTQQAEVRWLAALLFAQRAGLEPRALDLHGVRIRSNEQGRAICTIPTTEGADTEITLGPEPLRGR